MKANVLSAVVDGHLFRGLSLGYKNRSIPRLHSQFNVTNAMISSANYGHRSLFHSIAQRSFWPMAFQFYWHIQAEGLGYGAIAKWPDEGSDYEELCCGLRNEGFDEQNDSVESELKQP